jgi:hypothetical protein
VVVAIVDVVAAAIARLRTGGSPHLIVASSIDHGRRVQQAHGAAAEDVHREDARRMAARRRPLDDTAARRGRRRR